MAKKEKTKLKIADLPLNKKITAKHLEHVRGGLDKKPGKKALLLDEPTLGSLASG